MLRQVFFWAHLVVGLTTGLIVFILCFTGAVLTFEKQLENWAERDGRALPPAGAAERVPPGKLIALAAQVNGGSKVSNFEWFADSKMPVRVYFQDRSIALFNSWTGEALGRGAVSLRAFLRFNTELHTNLTLPRTGAWAVGGANLAFIFLLLSGLWIWWPRQWRWKALRSSLALRLDVQGKARDWNWHNVFGFWFLLPLFAVALTGIVLSYASVNQWWGEFAGRHLLAAVQPLPAAPAASDAAPGWTGAMAVVQRQFPDWRWMMTNNVPQGAAGTIGMQVGTGSFGQRSLVHSIGFDPATNTIVKTSAWENDAANKRARAIARFGHTGEIVGLWGQMLAFLACVAGLVLVYTGFALSWRRFFGRSA